MSCAKFGHTMELKSGTVFPWNHVSIVGTQSSSLIGHITGWSSVFSNYLLMHHWQTFLYNKETKMALKRHKVSGSARTNATACKKKKSFSIYPSIIWYLLPFFFLLKIVLTVCLAYFLRTDVPCKNNPLILCIYPSFYFN